MALEPIIFHGGSWDGRYTEIHKGDPLARSAERLNPDGGHDVYVRSQDVVPFVKMEKFRNGVKKPKTMKSTVFKFAGTKPPIPRRTA